ncbi:MAG: NAD-specific glutamate dehydrogenase [Syntrophus sp. PtaB.Bin001]|nr:MAG: NAD-specific glutamate dehydrogenase [Syntrophus sp. PtaB.Bin001]
MRFLAEDLFHLLLDSWHTCHTADENDFIDGIRRQTGILECRSAGTFDPVDQVFNKSFHSGPGQFDVHMLGARCIRRDEGQIDIRFHRRGKLHFRLLRRFLEPLECHLVVADVYSLVFLELTD